MNKKVRKFAVFLFLTACAGCTNSLQEPLSTDPTILSVETPKQVNFKAPTFTELQNKYMDIALNHELSQSSDSKLRAANLLVAEMTTDEKMEMIDLLTEQKNETTTLRTAQENSEEDAFYNAQYDTLVQELNRHPLVIEAMQKSDGLEPIESMMISYHEGDSVISKMQVLKGIEENKNTTTMRAARIMLAKWGKEIHYRTCNGLSPVTKTNLRQAMNEWEEAVNYKFRFKEVPNSGWNQFVWGIGCYWHICIKTCNNQYINGSATLGCVPWSLVQLKNDMQISTGLHEFGHVLGLIHEHQRPDRDKYITIHWNNILPQYKNQFYVMCNSYVYGDFDYQSIMMYQSYTGFSVIGPTHTKNNGQLCFEGDIMLSVMDKQKIKEIYR